MKSDEILHVMKHVLNLKEIQRGWTRKGFKDGESDADHSYGVAMLALMLAKAEGYDEEKIMKMALVHELCESITGDALPWDKDTKAKWTAVKAAELEATREILSGELLALAEEEHEQKTPEAKIVKEADMLDLCFQAVAYEKASGKDLSEFWDYGAPRIFTKTGKEILKELEKRR